MGEPAYKGNYGNGVNGVSSYRMTGPHNQMLPMASQSEQQYNNFQHHQQANHPMAFHYGPSTSSELAANMGALNLTNNHVSNMSNQSTDLNLAAIEFYPKSGPPLPPQGLLHQSTSAPSFESYSVMPKPAHPLLDNVHNSPVLTPSGSPQLQHRRVNPQLSPPLNMASAAAVHMASQQQQDLVQENFGGTTYFYNKDEYVSPTTRQTFPGYSVYAGVPPHIAHMQPNTNSSSFFVRDEIKMEILRKQAIVMSEMEGVTDVPLEVDNYCQLVPLEITAKSQPRGRFGYPCSVYKAVNQKDGLTYCLHRIHGFKLTNTKCMQVIDQWKKVNSPHIVTLREVFTTKSFNDNSIVFVYDYHPTAENLAIKHFSSVTNGYSSPFSVDGSARPFSAGKGARNAGHLSESNIWSYVIQLSGALRVMHTHKMSAHGLYPTKILVTDKNRLQINCAGILDVLTFDPNSLAALPQLQNEDLHSFGRIVLALACNSQLAFRPEQLNASLEHVKQFYSPDLNHLIRYLISSPSPPHRADLTINSVMPMIGARFYVELESVHNRVQAMEHELSKEVECGRLFRLQAKLNTILERPEFNMDSSWAETGDRYLLKLFRDYVYHQNTESGAPWIDMTHIVSALNKLDAGVSEKICLSSADENNVIIVSYQELKRCFEAAFGEIIQADVAQNYGGA